MGRLPWLYRMLVTSFLLGSGAVLAHPLQELKTSPPTLQSRSPAELTVILDAVSEKNGGQLDASDLVITSNGKQIPQDHIRLVDDYSSRSPAQLLLVIDTINSSQQDFIRTQAAVSAFLRENAGMLRQPTSILFLSAGVAKPASTPAPSPSDTALLHQRQLSVHRLNATTDGNGLARNFEEYATALTGTPEMSAGIGVSERVRLSLESLSFIAKAESAVPGAKVTLWLSPGWPYLARSEAKSSAQLFDSIVYFSDTLRAARILLYMIDPEGIISQQSAETNAFQPASGATLRMPVINTSIGIDFYKEYVRGVRKPEESNPNDLTLQVLALQSGGLVMQQNNDIKGMIDRCAGDVAKLTGVAFLPERTGNTTAYQEIRIRATHPTQNLRARTGFYLR